MDSHRKVMTQPAAVVQTGLKSSDDLPTFETKGSGESSTYSSVLTIEGKAAASTKLAKHAVGTPDISDTPEKRVSRLQSTHSGYSDSGIFESSSLAAKHLPLPRLPVLLRDMYSEYVEDSHFSVSTSYAEIQTSDSLESTPALTKRNTLERATSTSMFAPDPRSPSDPISPITPTNSTLQLVKMEEMEGAASDRSSTFAISSTPLLRRCHIAGETGASAATSGIFEAAGSVLTESDERLAAVPARSQTLPQATHDVSRSELRSKPPLPRVFHKSSGSLKTKKQQPKKTHPARRAASGASLLSLFGFRRKATSLQKQQPTAAAMPQPHLTKISTLPVEKLEERQARAMGTGVSTTPGWSASLYSSMSGDLGEAVRAHDDTGATANEIDALATQKTHQSSVLPQASHTACAETTDQSMGAIVCAQAGLVHAAADEPHAASESDQPTLRLSTTEVILAGNEEMEPRQADAEDEVIGISEHKLQPFSSREEAEVTADNRSGSGYTPSRRRSSASGGEISASNDSSSDSVEASWYRPHFSASDQEVQGGRKKKAKHRRCTQAERKEDSNITAKAKELNDEDRTKQQTVTPSGKPNISILDASTENPHEFPSIIEKQLAQQTLADVHQTDKSTPQKSDHEISRPQADRQTNEHLESSREEAMQENPLTTAKEQNVDNAGDNQKQAAKTEKIAQADDSTRVNIDENNAEGMTQTASAEAGHDVDAGILPKVSIKAGPVVVDVPTVDIQASVPGDVELPSLDVKATDLDGEMNVKAGIEMPEARLDIEPPAADMKVDAGGKFELPSLKVKLPHPHLKLGASGKAKAPKVDVEMPQAEADLDVSGKVDVPSTKVVIDADTDLDVDAGGKFELPTLKVKLPHPHLKLGASGKAKAPKVDVEMPEVDAGLDVSGGVEVPSAGIDVNADADLDVDAGGKIGLKKPKSPSFKVKLPHAHWKMGKSGKLKIPQAELETPHVDAGLDVSGGVDVPSTELKLDVDTDMDVGAGGKVDVHGKSPSFKLKMPKWHFGKSVKVEAPKVTAELPEVDAGLDVSGGAADRQTSPPRHVMTSMKEGYLSQQGRAG
nr:unnamed protein product [Spirometra erinaceieuropaei]